MKHNYYFLFSLCIIFSKTQNSCKFSPIQYIIIYFYFLYDKVAAVKRCYQNIRRTEMEQQDGKEEYVELQSKRRRYRSRRERV